MTESELRDILVATLESVKTQIGYVCNVDASNVKDVASPANCLCKIC
jgi:hypothetical protein